MKSVGLRSALLRSFAYPRSHLHLRCIRLQCLPYNRHRSLMKNWWSWLDFDAGTISPHWVESMVFAASWQYVSTADAVPLVARIQTFTLEDLIEQMLIRLLLNVLQTHKHRGLCSDRVKAQRTALGVRSTLYCTGVTQPLPLQ